MRILVGFGIDFKKRSIFFTLNGQFVCEKTTNYWDHRLLNLETLHATVSCATGIEFKVNFGIGPFMFDMLKYQRQRSLNEGAKDEIFFYPYSIISKYYYDLMQAVKLCRNFFLFFVTYRIVINISFKCCRIFGLLSKKTHLQR